MKTPRAYREERQRAAIALEQFNNAACIHFAEMLRLNDEQKRIAKELGQPIEDLIPADYFEAVYRILSFGPKQDRAVLILGTPNEIENLVSRVQRDRGFYDEKQFWIEL